MAYRSVSFPMTLNDLERQDARNHYFRWITLIRWYRLTENDKIRQETHVERGIFLGGNRRPYIKGLGLPPPTNISLDTRV